MTSIAERILLKRGLTIDYPEEVIAEGYVEPKKPYVRPPYLPYEIIRHIWKFKKQNHMIDRITKLEKILNFKSMIQPVGETNYWVATVADKIWYTYEGRWEGFRRFLELNGNGGVVFFEY